MVWIAGGLLALALLYCWLAGGQFARILAFLVFSVLFGFAAVVFFVGNHGDFKNFAGIGVAVVIAWFVASFPIEYQKSPRLWRRSTGSLETLPGENGRRL